MEEQIFFPFVEKRARLPLLYSEEHGSLADGLRVCEAALTALAVTGDAQRDKQLLAALQVRPWRQLVATTSSRPATWLTLLNNLSPVMA